MRTEKGRQSILYMPKEVRYAERSRSKFNYFDRADAIARASFAISFETKSTIW